MAESLKMTEQLNTVGVVEKLICNETSVDLMKPLSIKEFKEWGIGSIDHYLTEFEESLRRNLVPDDQYASYARAYMGPEINCALTYLFDTNSLKSYTYAEMRLALYNQFEGRLSVYKSAKFFCMTQKKNEPIKEFVGRLRKQAYLAKFNYEYETNYLSKQFLRGLENEGLAKEINCHNSQDFQTVYKCAMALEASRQCYAIDAVESRDEMQCAKTQSKNEPVGNKVMKTDNVTPYVANTILNLNDDCLMEIFKYLEIKDRLNAELVCRAWHNVSHKLWRCTRTYSSNRAIYVSWKNTYDDNYKKGQLMLLFEITLNKCSKNLTLIELKTFNEDTDRQVIHCIVNLIIRKCPNLLYIDMKVTNSHGLLPHTLMPIAKKLRNFRITIEDYIPQTHFQRFFSQTEKLEYLEVKLNCECEKYDEPPNLGINTSKPVFTCENLTEFVFECVDNRPSDSLVCDQVIRICKDLQKMKNLQKVTFHYYQYEGIFKFPKALKHLTLNLVEVPDWSFLCNRHLSSLEKFELTDESILKKEDLLLLATNCPKLQSLIIGECLEPEEILISNSDMKVLASLQNLESISIHAVGSVTGEFFKYFTTLKNVHCRNFKNMDVGVCELIRRCEKIERIQLDLDYTIDTFEDEFFYIFKSAVRAFLGRKPNKTKIDLFCLIGNKRFFHESRDSAQLHAHIKVLLMPFESLKKKLYLEIHDLLTRRVVLRTDDMKIAEDKINEMLCFAKKSVERTGVNNLSKSWRSFLRESC